METKTIDLPWQFIEKIVIDELKEAVILNQHTDVFGEKDEILLKSLAECLRYFMNVRDADAFLKDYDL